MHLRKFAYQIYCDGDWIESIDVPPEYRIRAEHLCQQVFAICKQAFGEIHPETAHSINKLAGISVSQNNYERAEILYQQALSIYEQKFDPRHPDVALVLNDWGLLATKQRQYQVFAFHL